MFSDDVTWVNSEHQEQQKITARHIAADTLSLMLVHCICCCDCGVAYCYQ